jgi:hypothetical protein
MPKIKPTTPQAGSPAPKGRKAASNPPGGEASRDVALQPAAAQRSPAGERIHSAFSDKGWSVERDNRGTVSGVAREDMIFVSPDRSFGVNVLVMGGAFRWAMETTEAVLNEKSYGWINQGSWRTEDEAALWPKVAERSQNRPRTAVKPGAYREEAVLQTLNPDVAGLIRDGVRLAQTDQPIIGCVLKPELVEPFIAAFAALGSDLGENYAEKLRSGAITPMVPSEGGNRIWRSGELFFTS